MTDTAERIGKLGRIKCLFGRHLWKVSRLVPLNHKGPIYVCLRPSCRKQYAPNDD